MVQRPTHPSPTVEPAWGLGLGLGFGTRAALGPCLVAMPLAPLVPTQCAGAPTGPLAAPVGPAGFALWAAGRVATCAPPPARFAVARPPAVPPAGGAVASGDGAGLARGDGGLAC